MTMPIRILKTFFYPVILLLLTLPVKAEELNYVLDKNLSSIRVLVYKQGALQWFGHNHVISHSRLEGELKRNTANNLDNAFTLALAVTDFIVDDAQQRILSGDAFLSPVDSEDAQATRENMLSQSMLDEKRFNKIEISGSIASIASSQPVAHININIKGVSKHLSVPIQLQLSDTKMTSRGRFSVKQSDFKIEPFSLMGGMLAVQDQVDIVFDLAAIRSGEPRSVDQ